MPMRASSSNIYPLRRVETIRTEGMNTVDPCTGRGVENASDRLIDDCLDMSDRAEEYAMPGSEMWIDSYDEHRSWIVKGGGGGGTDF